MALTTDTSILTAVANDYGYDRSFSGRSRRYAFRRRAGGPVDQRQRGQREAAVNKARELEAFTIALLGRDGGPDRPHRGSGPDRPLAKHPPHPGGARLSGHILCDLVEEAMAGAQ